MNILCIHYKRIGDLLMITPAFRQIAEAFPDSHLSVVCSSAAAQCLKSNPFVTRVFPVDRTGDSLWDRYQRFLQIRQAHFDVIIDFHGKVPSAVTTRFSRAGMRIGFHKKGRSWAYTHRIPEPPESIYRIRKNLSLLQLLGIVPSESRMLPEIYIDERDEAWAEAAWREAGLPAGCRVAAISPVSIVAKKVWPSDRFAMLCDGLIKRYGVRVLLMNGPGEEAFSLQVQSLMMHPDQSIIAPVGSLTGCAALMKKCAFWVGNDNGPRHLAIAAGLPTFGIFGPIDPVRWTPPEDSSHGYLSGRSQASPGTPPEEMIRALTADQVMTSIFQWIDAGAYV